MSVIYHHPKESVGKRLEDGVRVNSDQRIRLRN